MAHAGASIVGRAPSRPTPRAPAATTPAPRPQAELLALAADSPRLRVVAVRPHLVWGPGDTQLVARIVERARAGRLPLLGHGAALIDTTYVDNAASAIVAALERADDVHGRRLRGHQRRAAPGGRAARPASARPPACAPPALAACRPGWREPPDPLIEAAWRIRPGVDEPPMTRFLAEQLSTAHWFDQRQTRADLRWQPAVSLDEGFRRLAASYSA